LNTPDRYHALLKVCDFACAQAASTGADRTPEFWQIISEALEDDCRAQAQAAARIAGSLRLAADDKARFFQLLPGNQSTGGLDGK